MESNSYSAAEIVKLVADFERAVIEGTHKLATPANHFHIEELREKLVRGLPGPSIPQGWKLVPEEPTAEMIDDLIRGLSKSWEEGWRRACAIAPQPSLSATGTPQEKV